MTDDELKQPTADEPRAEDSAPPEQSAPTADEDLSVEELTADPELAEATVASLSAEAGASEAVEVESAEVGETEPAEAAAPATAEEVAALRAQLEQQTQQREALHAQALRIAADFENFRKRTQREREELEVQVKSAAIGELLPAIDNFERARAQIKPQTDGEMTIHKSYQGVYKQLVDALKSLGVSAMRPEGQEFDPNFHEAVLREPTDDYPEGTVVEQLVRGYLLGDRILRHAMVKVAAPPEPVVGSDESEPNSGEAPEE